MDTERNRPAIESGMMVAKVCRASSIPDTDTLPYAISTPEHSIARAVRVQINIVSVNTSIIPNIPCFTGSFELDDA